MPKKVLNDLLKRPELNWCGLNLQVAQAALSKTGLLQ